MVTINNPLLALLGIAVMALYSWGLSCLFPVLDAESFAHRETLPLDGLRGVLASSVFLHHSYVTYVFFQTGRWIAPASNFYAQLGPTAVTLFFFISGYLFWGKMQKDPNSIRAGRLWPNRMRRILPAYWAAILLAFAVTALMTRFELHESPRRLLVHAAQWLLVGFPCLPNLNGLSQQRMTGGVFWTLRTELLFYLLLPALVWFRKLWRVLLLVAGAGAAYAAMSFLPSPEGGLGCSIDLLKRFTLAMAVSFSVGMLAVYPRWNARWLRWIRSPGMAMGCVFLLTIQLWLVPAEYAWWEPILLAPVFLVVSAGNSFFGALTSRAMRCLGQISYSVYIFHGVLLFALTYLLNQRVPIAGMTPFTYWFYILVISLVVVTVSTVTYCYIERPFLPRPKKLKPVLPMSVETALAGTQSRQ